MSALDQEPELREALDIQRTENPELRPFWDAIERVLSVSPTLTTSTAEVYSILGLDSRIGDAINLMGTMRPSTILAVGFVLGLQTAGEDIIVPDTYGV